MTTYEAPQPDSLPEELYTEGISPKVLWPSAVLGSVAVIALIIGIVIDESTLTQIAIGLLAALGITIPAGFAAPPGDVRDSRPPDKVHLP